MQVNLDDIFPTHNGVIDKLDSVCAPEQQSKEYPLNKDYSKLVYINNELPIGYLNVDLVTQRKTDNGVYIYSMVMLPAYIKNSIGDKTNTLKVHILQKLLSYIIEIATTNHQKCITLYLPWDYNNTSSNFNDTVDWFLNCGEFQPVFPDQFDPNVDEGHSGVKKIGLKRYFT